MAIHAVVDNYDDPQTSQGTKMAGPASPLFPRPSRRPFPDRGNRRMACPKPSLFTALYRRPVIVDPRQAKKNELKPPTNIKKILLIFVMVDAELV
jgi:hypothetical protein